MERFSLASGRFPRRFIRLATLLVTVLVASLMSFVSTDSAQGSAPKDLPEVTVTENVNHDLSEPLRSMRPAEVTDQNDTRAAKPRHSAEVETSVGPSAVPGPDGARDISPTTANMPATDVNFEGMDNTLNVNASRPNGVYPPDTNGDVGPNHYVQIVNFYTQIFDRTGNSIWGPSPTNTFFSGFGGICETTNRGDPIVKFDRLANRWLISQFAYSLDGSGNFIGPFYECVAVSAAADPTGSYYRYAFESETYFPDYPKIGVWPDGYYATYAAFAEPADTYIGPRSCVFDRAAMLTGAAATQQCFDPSTPYLDLLLPADLDGLTPPPPGSPNFQAGLNFSYPGTTGNQLQLWQFHVDWNNPANSTMTGPDLMTVTTYTIPCGGSGGNCASQPGTTQKLDTLGDRLLYRFAYRNYGDHESLVANHSVDAGSGVLGVRWYEIRTPSGTPAVFQQGTYAPDTDSRWMGSVAMDNAGDLAAGYSVSSSTVYPSIRYAGRLASDPAGTFTQGETSLQVGSGSQTGSLGRWGDYSAMQIDPVDDCTFWYTSEYVYTTGQRTWRTKVASFKFPSCQSKPGAPTSVSATAGVGQASISWTAPIQTGTSAITGYTVTSNPAIAIPASCSNVATPYCTFTGLANGTSYTFTVTATNSVGTSLASDPSASALPALVALVAQTSAGNCVQRRAIRNKKHQVTAILLLKASCLTNAGQQIKVAATAKKLRKRASLFKLFKPTKGSYKGSVLLSTRGRKLLVTIKWTAPATGAYAAYSSTWKGKVKTI